MKKKTKINLSYEPCGLSIPSNVIFKSARNLGLSLMAALTGQSTEEIEINRCTMSIGLGCFSLVGINQCNYDGLDDLDIIDDNNDWSLYSAIRYILYKPDGFYDEEVARFSMMNLNIHPCELVGEDARDDAIQLFGPKRLLSKIRAPEQRLVSYANSDLDVSNFFEHEACDPNDSVLFPSSDEMELYWNEKNESRKFRILLNIITSFASELSMKLLEAGFVQPSCLLLPANDALERVRWFIDGKIGKPWTPTKSQVRKYIGNRKMTMSDFEPEALKLIPWLNDEFLAKVQERNNGYK